MRVHAAEDKFGKRRVGRIDSLDVARGFAIVAICYANTQLNFVTTYSALDEWTAHLSKIFFNNTFYPLFSLLFGVGFFLLLSSKKARLQAFLVRLFLLFAVGVVHAVLLYKGDILTRYALLGLALPLATRLSSVNLIVVATFLWGTTVAWGLSISATFGTGSLDTVPLINSFTSATAYRADIFAEHLLADLIFTGPLVLACFCLGIVLGRQLREPKAWHMPFLRRFAFASLVLTVPYIAFSLSEGPGTHLVLAYLVAKPLYAFGLAAATVSLYQSWFRAQLSVLIPLGKLALTNYVSQSLFYTALYTAPGLGLYQVVGSAGGFAISTLILALQIGFSRAWLKHFSYGPLETLWRQTSNYIDTGLTSLAEHLTLALNKIKT